jgi:hypothetical protein
MLNLAIFTKQIELKDETQEEAPQKKNKNSINLNFYLAFYFESLSFT